MNSVIKIDKLVKQYTNFELNITTDFPKGYITGIIGGNGAGKTTLINSILNIIKAESGLIYVDGNNINDESFIYKDKIGIVLDSNFFPSFWTAETLEKNISPYYNHWSHKKYMDYIDIFNLDKEKTISSLSKGMQMKLMLAVALAHGSKTLILDEPTSGLDPISRNELLEILQEFVQTESNSVIFSTHITNDLEKIADYIIYLIKGKIDYSGTKDMFLENYRIVQGSKDKLNDNLIKFMIANEISDYGFRSLIETKNLSNFKNDDFQILNPSIEEIMIFKNKNK
ncbi:ABC transporter ATP-binding protein [Anaerococcus sp.]|uniref:ABC transporter ATP-binding protein n=1 Tax=Anaerococcus sp. TaxID=1872515 RepID=UPI00280AEB35|nr:ABC transporter ATP-binding protein [Anaerococcus sp.]MDU3177210.1 ABC transporter ATP-binding protein [Anaerococcus sp.]MDU5535168.1 ABC transporter ATP-binding protein [Anaerococcus sp.]